MPQKISANHFTDEAGNPDGGQTFGPGFTIAWHRGPLTGDVTREECVTPEHQWVDGAGDPHDWITTRTPCRRDPNGAFVETIIAVAADRLAHYQTTPFACAENQGALNFLREALGILNERTTQRQEQGIEGSHEVGDSEDSWREAVAAKRVRLVESLGFAQGVDVWITPSSGGVIGPTNVESAVDVLLDDPLAQVHVVDPNA